MRKRAWLIILGVIAAVALALWLAWPAPEPEPTYNGHTLSYWLDTLPVASESKMTAAPVLEARQAREAISNIGTNALPLLLSRLRHEADPLRRAAYSLLVRVPSRFQPKWLAEWASPEKAQSQADIAAYAFSILGPRARPALPALNKIMNDPKAGRTAAGRATYVLANLGEPALPLLLAVLQGTNAPNRPVAAAYIGTVPALRTNAAAAVPNLIACLEDRDPEVRRSAALALGWVSLQPELAVPALSDSAQTTTDAVLRRYLLSALGEFGPKARDATNCVFAALSDPDRAVRKAATNALLRIAPELLTIAPPPR
jgi:hypothetical protein